MSSRLKKLQQVLRGKKFDGLIITNPVNIFYLSGFRGVSPQEREAILIVTQKTAVLITARLYQQEARKLVSRDLKIKIAAERNEINQFIKDAISKVGMPTETKVLVGFEEHDLKFSEFKQFTKLLKGKKLVPVKHLIEDLRIVKTADEIKNIERAQIISQKGFEKVIKTIRVGQTEAEIAERLEKIIKSLGGQGLAFESIIASGPNSALPHHITSDRRLTKNDVLLFDFGAKFQDYCADLSRTIFVGRANNHHAKIYHHVAQAQATAIAKIKHGARAPLAHKAVSAHFKKHNLDDYFLHSLGHGIGLQVHEKPSLSAKSKDTLKEGMVFSVEPGLYFPAWGGVRIEDLIVIKNGKAKLLGQSAQFLEIKA